MTIKKGGPLNRFLFATNPVRPRRILYVMLAIKHGRLINALRLALGLV